MGKRELLLAVPRLYEIFQAFVGKLGFSRLYLYSKYLPYTPGLKVLDLGCGPGTCTHLFQKEDYLGIDIDDSYIKYARTKYQDYQFQLVDFSSSSLSSIPRASFDLIFAYGLFHHLDDETARKFLSNAHTALKLGGRMVCIDGCTFDGQTLLSRRITLADRGKYIRDPQILQSFAVEAGFIANIVLEKSAYSIPYSLMVMSLHKQ